MENVTGLFHTNLSAYSFKNSDCHKFSFVNNGDLNLGYFDILDIRSLFLAFVKS